MLLLHFGLLVVVVLTILDAEARSILDVSIGRAEWREQGERLGIHE
jgi:hypothetical protein